MDAQTPPFLFDLEERTAVMKKPRIVIRKASCETGSRTEHVPQKKRKRRMQQQFYSSSDEEEEEEVAEELKATAAQEPPQTLDRSSRRKAWIDYQDSDSETEASQTKIYDDELPLGVIQARAGSTGFQLIMTKHRSEAGRSPKLESAPVFHPTEEEFQDTLKYIESIRPLVEPFGICRVVPPSSWRPPCSLRDNAKENIRFSTRVQKIHKLQVREPTTRNYYDNHQASKRKGRARISKILDFGPQAAAQQEFFGFEPGPSFTIKEFEAYAKELKEKYFEYGEEFDQQAQKAEPSVETIEGEFWRIVEKPTEQIEVLYGADIETNVFKSGFPKPSSTGEFEGTPYDKSGWNLNNIARLRDSVLEFEEDEISGVVVPWLYVGMCFSSFCWHVEDHHLYSVNYMHWGSPKVWYGVPGSAATKLEQAMKKRLPELFAEQPDLLHKLVTQLSPSILRQEGVPVYKVVQNSGEFVITFPRAYHAGFNCGFNCAEAVNVAPVNWLPHGQSAVEIYKQQHRKTSISHDKLLLAAVKRAIKTSIACDGASSSYIAHRHILADALRARVQLECSRRALLEGLNVRPMDGRFNSSDERECCVCSYDLHLSAAGCGCNHERYACLEHAMSFCGCSWEGKFVMYRHELLELDDFLRILEGRPPPIKLKIFRPELKTLNNGLNLASTKTWEAISAAVSAAGSNQVLTSKALVIESRSGPRVAKVVRPNKASSCEVELLRTGRLVAKPGWHMKNAIFPAGFKSRVLFYDYLDLPRQCYYLSEVLDCTDGKPVFKVSMETRPCEKMICSSMDFCWQAIQERVNTEIKRLRESGKTNLPPLKPPESVKGLDMFGLSVPSVIQAVEALDPMHLCDDYWTERPCESENQCLLDENEQRYASFKGFLSNAGKDQLSELQHILNSKWAAGSWLMR